MQLFPDENVISHLPNFPIFFNSHAFVLLWKKVKMLLTSLIKSYRLKYSKLLSLKSWKLPYKQFARLHLKLDFKMVGISAHSADYRSA